MFTMREQWLLAAIAELHPIFDTDGLVISRQLKVSCGFSGTGDRKKVTGECWPGKIAHIFISPLQADENRVLETLVHELLHACLPKGTKHGPPFKQGMAAVGLEGRAKSTKASEDLLKKFKPIVKKIGTYPHTAISLGDRDEKKQSTRLLKMACTGCEFSVRVTKLWIDQMKDPACWCCGAPMTTPETDSGGAEDETDSRISGV